MMGIKKKYIWICLRVLASTRFRVFLVANYISIQSLTRLDGEQVPVYSSICRRRLCTPRVLRL